MTSESHGFRVLLVAVIIPVIITIAAEIVLLVLAGQSPARVATHWGFSGQANGYGSPYTYPILMASIAVPVLALLGGGSVVVSHRSPMSPVIKLTAVAGVWMSTFLAILLIGSLLQQPTVASESAPHSPGVPLTIGIVVGLALAVGAWFVLPKAVPRVPASEREVTPAVSLAPDERATWIRTVSASRGVLLVLIGAVVLVGVAELLVVFLSGGRAWPIAFVPALLLIIVLIDFAWTVRVDASGVRIRSAAGVPRFSIAMSNIASASVVEVNALGEFGGWGIRWSLNGRLGIIMHSGTALEIHRHKGIDVVVTIADAKTAAALINGFVQRDRTVA